jgi:hypothetical protein
MQLYVCSVQYIVSLLFAAVCYFLITGLVFFNIPFIFVFCFQFFCILCICTVLCTVSPSVCSCLFPIFVQVY